MIIIDGGGLIRFANRQVSALFGYNQDELIGQRVELLMPERFQARHVSHRETYSHTLRLRPMGAGLELFGRRRDGSEFPVEISLSPIHDPDAAVLVAAAIRDVSDRKRVEAELIVARETAERARESADRASQAKSRFLATASHDLRQPLQTLALLNGTLRRMVTEPLSLEALAQQEQAIGTMSGLLSALLDMSKLESGSIKPERKDFPLRPLFGELRAEFARLAAGKALQLRIEECAESVYSDRTLIGQVLRNLISNAIKYTVQGEVTLRAARVPEAAIRIDVVDTGVGIPADQVRYIYDEFYQIGIAANSSHEGYGLGLSIVQRIVHLLGVQLSVTSELGKGSVFSLVLPAAMDVSPAPRTQLEPACAAAPRTARLRVLLVEDDPGVRDATRMLLKVEGYEVTAVASLAQALKETSPAARPDLLVTDYHLANGETGIETIAALREALHAPLKAVLITGDTSLVTPLDPDLRVASKPIRAEELLTLLRAML